MQDGRLQVHGHHLHDHPAQTLLVLPYCYHHHLDLHKKERAKFEKLGMLSFTNDPT